MLKHHLKKRLLLKYKSYCRKTETHVTGILAK